MEACEDSIWESSLKTFGACGWSNSTDYDTSIMYQ
jgi:hypothetical protein